MKNLFITLILSLLILVNTSHAQENKAANICNKEIKKKQPQVKRAGKYCIEAGQYYKKKGKYSKALEYYKKALTIIEKLLGKEHPATAMGYNNIGLLYQRMGDYPKALNYLKKSLVICEKVLGKEHDNTANSYNNIGFLYNDMEDYPKALKYYQKALAIYEKVLGKKHTATATGYNNLGSIYDTMGNYPKALGYYQKSLAIYEKVLGKEHTDTASSYNNIGFLYDTMADYPKAYKFAKKSFDTFLLNRDKNFAILDSKQKKLYLKQNRGKVPLLLSTAYLYTKSDPVKTETLARSGTNAWLNYKGNIFDSENAIAMLYSSTKDKKLKAKIDDLVVSKRYLAKLYQSLPKPKERETWKKRIKTTEEKIGRLTNEVASKATRFKEQQGLKSITYKDITSHLDKDELYIDYAKAGGYYYLFSLDHQENITFIQIDTNSTKKIDNLVKTFREDVNTILNDTKIADEKLKTLTQSSKEKLSQLYKLLIEKPLADTIKNKNSLPLGM